MKLGAMCQVQQPKRAHAMQSRCGHDATERWLARQRELLLPVPYFHRTFTGTKNGT